MRRTTMQCGHHRAVQSEYPAAHEPLLDAEFDERAFDHRAFYNEALRRIEMHLVSPAAQRVRCNGSHIAFAAGETIHTESSYKYTLEGFAELADSAGLSVQKTWLDDEALFSLHYLTRKS
jgi:uncharacterized SAM-dependent methyltransferase